MMTYTWAGTDRFIIDHTEVKPEFRGKKADKTEWQKRKKAIKEKLKTKQNYENELQVVFNTFVRLRDQNQNCPRNMVNSILFLSRKKEIYMNIVYYIKVN